MEVAPALVPPFQLPTHAAPQLLVSVRNADEALSAIRGGCQILDIKEPDRGSLGMADPSVSNTLIKHVRDQHADVIVSAALGEVLDWPFDVDAAAAIESKEVPQGCDLVKLGCAGLGDHSNWPDLWNTVRRRISNVMQQPVNWVAVGYVDWEPARAPRISAIVEAALASNCRGVLLDTYTKTGAWLLDWISIAELQQIARRVQDKGLFLALAGSVSVDRVRLLDSVPANIIAIRGAACASGDRRATVSESAVRDFQQRLKSRDLQN